MAKLGISTGAAPDDGTGSSLLVGAARVNSNFDELYTLLGAGSTTNLAPGIVTSIVGGDNISVSGSGQVTITGAANTSHVNAASLNVSGISTFGGSVTASTFTGNLTGNASGNAGTVTVTAENSTIATVYPLFGGNGATATGNFSPSTDTGFTYNPSTGELTTVQLTGTNANVTGILTAANVSTAGSVTAATLFGDGSNLSGVGGGSTEFVSTNSLVVTAGMSTISNTQTFDGTYHYYGGSGFGAALTFGSVGRNGQDLIVQNNNKILLRNGPNTKLEVNVSGTIVTGVATATSFSGHGNDLVTSQWAVANSGSSHYTFTGPVSYTHLTLPTNREV